MHSHNGQLLQQDKLDLACKFVLRNLSIPVVIMMLIYIVPKYLAPGFSTLMIATLPAKYLIPYALVPAYLHPMSLPPSHQPDQ